MFYGVLKIRLVIFFLAIYAILSAQKAMPQELDSNARMAVLQHRLQESVRINLLSALKLRDFSEYDLAAENLDLAFESLAAMSRARVLEGDSVSLIQQLLVADSLQLSESELTAIIEEIYRKSSNGYGFSASNRKYFEASRQLAVAIDYFRFYKANNDTLLLKEELANAIEFAELMSQSENEFYASIGAEILDSLRFELALIVPQMPEVDPSDLIESASATDISDLYWQLVRPNAIDFDKDNGYIRRQVDFLTGQRRDELNTWLARITKYLPEQRQIFDKYNLPKDIIFLSVIESGLSPRANSYMAAKGLWQFISSTGRLYGLHRTWWKDERYNPAQAGDAAARHLQDLYHYNDK